MRIIGKVYKVIGENFNLMFLGVSILKTTGNPMKWIICFSPVLLKVFFAQKAIISLLNNENLLISTLAKESLGGLSLRGHSHIQCFGS